MATFQQWNYPLSEVTYNPTVSPNVSSYFVRPNKVVKTSSRNTSPRHLGRRKTTTAASVSARTRSAVDHLRSTTELQNSGVARSRPVSWHPDHVVASNFNMSPSVDAESSSYWGFSTAQVHGLFTPVPYSSINEPLIPELFTPLDEPSKQDSTMMCEGELYRQPASGQGQAMAESFPFSLYAQQPWIQPEIHHSHTASAPNLHTAPPSPNCPPLQDVRLDTLSLRGGSGKLHDGSDELVGMGLYDSPAEVQSSSLLFGGPPGQGRKGLKLEESFEPTEQEGDEEEEEEDEEQEAEAEDEGMESDDTDDLVDQKWSFSGAATTTDYDSQSIASHLTYGMEARPAPLASTYLATLRQMNSAYYPADYPCYGQGYGWI
jgi:hypothetical protein